MRVKLKGEFCLACIAKIKQLLREEIHICRSKDDCKAMRRMVWGKDVSPDLEPCVGFLGGKGFFRADQASLKETERRAIAKINAIQAMLEGIRVALESEGVL